MYSSRCVFGGVCVQRCVHARPVSEHSAGGSGYLSLEQIPASLCTRTGAWTGLLQVSTPLKHETGRWGRRWGDTVRAGEMGSHGDVPTQGTGTQSTGDVPEDRTAAKQETPYIRRIRTSKHTYIQTCGGFES